MRYVIAFISILFCIGATNVPTPCETSTEPIAFPGAEGYGACANGGRGGTVYPVTTTACTGAGSITAAINQTGASQIVFDVGGTIDCSGETTELRESNGNMTLACNTAPGDDGVIIKGVLSVRAGNVVVRGCRFFPTGDTLLSDENMDAFKVQATSGTAFTRVLVDHSEFGWANDETVSFYQADDGGAGYSQITFSNNIIMESLNCNVYEQGGGPDCHGNSIIVDGDDQADNDCTTELSVFRNFITFAQGRNPRYAEQCDPIEHRNNLHYCNYGDTSVPDDAGQPGVNIELDDDGEGGLQINIVGNYGMSCANQTREDLVNVTSSDVSSTLKASSQVGLVDNKYIKNDDTTLTGLNVITSGDSTNEFQESELTLSPSPVVAVTTLAVDNVPAAVLGNDQLRQGSGAIWPRKWPAPMYVINNWNAETGETLDCVVTSVCDTVDTTQFPADPDVNRHSVYTDVPTFDTAGTVDDFDGDGIRRDAEIWCGLSDYDATDAAADADSDGWSNLEELSLFRDVGNATNDQLERHGNNTGDDPVSCDDTRRKFF